MNAASVCVLALLLGLAALAVYRCFRKGAPCSCGCSKDCRRCKCKRGGCQIG